MFVAEACVLRSACTSVPCLFRGARVSQARESQANSSRRHLGAGHLCDERKLTGAGHLLSAAEDVRAVELRQLRIAPGLALGVVALILRTAAKAP